MDYLYIFYSFQKKNNQMTKRKKKYIMSCLSYTFIAYQSDFGWGTIYQVPKMKGKNKAISVPWTILNGLGTSFSHLFHGQEKSKIKVSPTRRNKTKPLFSPPHKTTTCYSNNNKTLAQWRTFKQHERRKYVCPETAQPLTYECGLERHLTDTPQRNLWPFSSPC